MPSLPKHGDREAFYQNVRERTVKSWRKAYMPSQTDEQEKAEKLVEKLRTKPESVYSINNVLWVIASIGVFYFTDFGLVVLYDTRVNRTWLNVGCVFLMMAVACCLYCVIWLSKVKGIKHEKWEEHNMFVIPVATISSILCMALVCYSLWPIWNVFTIFIVGVQFMGFIVVVAMVPDIV